MLGEGYCGGVRHLESDSNWDGVLSASTDHKTLGTVVYELFVFYLTSYEKTGWSEVSLEPSPDEPPFRFRMQLALRGPITNASLFG